MPAVLRRPAALATTIAVLAAAGVTAGVVLAHRHRSEPLPPLAVTTFTVPTSPTALPFRFDAPPGCPAFSFGSPVEPNDWSLDGGTREVVLVPTPASGVMVSVQCLTEAQRGGLSLDTFVDGLRRHPENAHLVADPVVERGPLGDAVRTDEHPSGLRVTEWRLERDGRLVTVGYVRTWGDTSHDADVQSMLASWTWG